MHWQYYLAGLLAIGILSASTLETEFSPGGTSFDLEKISHRRFHNRPIAGKNLSQSDAWRSSSWLSGMIKNQRDALYTRCRPFGNIEIRNTSPYLLLELKRSIGLETVLGKQANQFKMALSQSIPLQDHHGGVYQISYQSRNQVIGNMPYEQLHIINFLDSEHHPIRRSHGQRISPSGDWQLCQEEISVPAGTHALTLSFQTEGCGILQIKHVNLIRKAPLATPLSVELFPGTLLDNRFVLATDLACPMLFRFRNNQPSTRDWQQRTILLNIDLPDSLRIIGTNAFLSKDIQQHSFQHGSEIWRRWSFRVTPDFLSRLGTKKTFEHWYLPAVLLMDTSPTSQPHHHLWNDCSYYLTEGDELLSPRGFFTLEQVPKPQRSKTPNLFRTGFNSITRDIMFQQVEAQRKFAEMAGYTGCSILISRAGPTYRNLLRSYGFTMLTTDVWGYGNGYLVGACNITKKPREANFLDLNGKPISYSGIPGTCPGTVYKRQPYYLNTVLPELSKHLDGFDGLQPNWEPYVFRGKGCFCAKCRSDFAEFAHLSQEQVTAIWPKQLQPGAPYHELGIRFRSQQQKRLVETLHEDCLKLGGKAVGFCPEVGTDQLIRYPDYIDEQGEYSPYEYAGKLNWLNVWGPYVWWQSYQPYHYQKGENLITWEYARRVIRDYRASFPDPDKCAKLMAMPHGCQADSLAQPEGLYMDQISSFLAGYNASMIYFFPKGYDYRYWKALAEANNLIADNEDCVCNGKRLDNITVTPESPFPTPVKQIAPKFLPDVKETSLLQVAAFKKDDIILIAVGNFWAKGDVVFTLKIPDLPATQRFTIREKAYSRQFTATQNEYFNGEMLEQGILLHAGALRWAFFEIAAASKQVKEKRIGRHTMKTLQAICRHKNQQAALDEAKHDSQLFQENNIGILKTMKGKDISCIPIHKNGKQLLKITAGKASFLMNPEGMALDSWIADKQELCHKQFGLSAFWSPGRSGLTVSSPFRITQQKLLDKSLEFTGEMTISGRQYPLLAGIRLTKTIQISTSGKAVTFTVVLTNTQALPISDVGYRWYFMPTAWNSYNQGHIIYNNQEILHRPQSYTLLSSGKNAATDQIIRKLFKVTTPNLSLKSTSFTFVHPNKHSITFTPTPQDCLAGIAIWSVPSVMISATFEPFYAARTLAPQESVQFTANFRFN